MKLAGNRRPEVVVAMEPDHKRPKRAAMAVQIVVPTTWEQVGLHKLQLPSSLLESSYDSGWH